MKNLILIISLIIALFLLFEIFRNVVGNKLSNKLIDLLNSNNMKEFNDLIESKKVNFFIHPFNKNFLKLSLAISNNNKDEVKNIMNIFKGVKLDTKQKEALYTRCFQYFIAIKDKDESSKYRQLIKNNNPANDHEDLDMVFNTYLEDGYDYLDIYLNKLDTVNPATRIAYESHISQMFLNKGDKRNSSKYKKLAEEHLKDKNPR